MQGSQPAIPDNAEPFRLLSNKGAASFVETGRDASPGMTYWLNDAKPRGGHQMDDLASDDCIEGSH
jgi:hypothetical protein